MKTPFYDQIRPKRLEDMVGQAHILSEGRLIPRLYAQKKITSFIFYGPPGTGKTTLANILIENAELSSYRLNATYSKTQDIRDILDSQVGLLSNQSIVILIDEIHNFNKKQQQLLLEYIEDGRVVLLANTTENPYFHVYKSLLSRTQIVEFKSLTNEDILCGLKLAICNVTEQEIDCTKDALQAIVSASNGDFRRALSILGLILELETGDVVHINRELVRAISGSKAIDYDIQSTAHYDLLSAFQKSIRGSDPDAAIHYLARLCYAEDLDSIARRLLVIACEDVGLAYPNAISIVKACVDAAYMIGFPEARIPLAQAVILLATAPKSNSANAAIDEALADLKSYNVTQIPKHILNAGSDDERRTLGKALGYKYPHDYPNGYVQQRYMPDELEGKVYYRPKGNKFERAIADYMNKMKQSNGDML